METVVPTNNPIFKTFKTLKEVKSDEERHVEEHDTIGQLANDPRWHAFKRVIELRMEALEALSGAFDPKDTVESVGFRFLASRVALAHLEDLLNLPDVIQQAAESEQTGESNRETST